MAPSYRRGPWVPEEDQLLLQLVREQGPNNWVRISQHISYRSAKQCRERFHQNLKPSLNREPISPEEGLLIERMVNEMGKRWAEIARRLGNRSDNAVKNWWNGSVNRKRRGLSTHVASSSSRTCNGRVEAPYTRASTSSSSRSSPPLWTRSPRRTFRENPLVGISSTSQTGGVASSSSTPSTAFLEPLKPTTPIFNNLQSINRPMDAPLTSPVCSEVSHALSVDPPSLVSDHNSVSSASPRTLPSPQLVPRLVSLRPKYEEMRGQSAPAMRATPPEENYLSALPYQTNQVSESLAGLVLMAHRGPELTRSSWHQHAASIPRVWSRSPGGSKDGRGMKSPPRDARMGFETLLN